MLIDNETLLSEDQAVTASAASTNIIDLGAVGSNAAGTPPVPHLKAGTRARIWVQVTTAFATLTSLQASVEVADETAFDTTNKTILAGEDIALASLTAGKVMLNVAIPAQVDARYLRVNYTVTGSSATAGKVSAGIIHDQDVSI